MNLTTVLFGAALIAYGLVTLVLRRVRPQVFHKLGPMKERWGERAGLWLHVVSYSLMPLVAGALMVSRGMRGVAIF